MEGFLKSLLCTQQCHYSHWSWTLPGHFGINYRFSLQVLSERASCWLWENKGDTVRKDLINSLLPLDVEKEAQSRKMMGNSYTAGVSRGAGTRTELSTLPVQSIISSTSVKDRGRRVCLDELLANQLANKASSHSPKMTAPTLTLERPILFCQIFKGRKRNYRNVTCVAVDHI